MLIIVSYDITDNRRRTAVAQELKNFGERVQRSVFECHLTTDQTEELHGRLRTLIDPGSDRVRYYRICRKDQDTITIMGEASASKDWDFLVV